MRLRTAVVLAAMAFADWLGGGRCQANLFAQTMTAPAPAAPSGCGGSVPVQGANAGFTACALNYDYSQPSGAPSAMIDCTGSNTSLPLVSGGPGVGPNSSRCAAGFTQAVDPITGQTVLKIKWLKSYGIGFTNSVLAAGWHDTSHYVDFPNFYIEEVFRLDASSNNTDSNYSGLADVPYVVGNKFGTGPNPLQMEYDVPELSASQSGSTTQGIATAIQWNPSRSSKTNWTSYTPLNTHTPGGWTANAYHKYGYLVTSNGSITYACSFIDDILQSCVQPALLTAQFTQRNLLVFQVGNPASPNSSTDITVYVQYTRVWSCPSWALAAGVAPTAATMCNGSTLFNSGGLTYWH